MNQAAENMAIAVLRGDNDAARMLADYLCEHVFNTAKTPVMPVQVIPGQASVEAMVFFNTSPSLQEMEDVGRKVRAWIHEGGILCLGPVVGRVELYRLELPVVSTLPLQRQPAGAGTPGQLYYDTVYCFHCEADSQHRCYDAGHGRDSSGDWRTCLRCHWTWTGLDGQYHPPDPADLVDVESNQSLGVPGSVPQLQLARRHTDPGENR